MEASQIIPRLWLGNFNDSQNLNFIMRERITVIINCTKDLPFLPINGVIKYRIPVDDNLQYEEMVAMSAGLSQILPVIDTHYRNGRSILIHCAAGIQRSAIVVLSYLYAYRALSSSQAYSMIKRRRPIAFSPSMNFARSFLFCFGHDA